MKKGKSQKDDGKKFSRGDNFYMNLVSNYNFINKKGVEYSVVFI